MLVEGLIGVSDVCVLGAPPKIGKTAAALDLAVSVAAAKCDTKWFGLNCVADEGCWDLDRKVLYLNLENPAEETTARIRSALVAQGLTEDDIKGNLHVLNLRDDQASYDTDALWSKVAALAKLPSISEMFDLIVIDPIYLLIDGDENSNQAMARFMSEEIAAYRDAYGAAVVFTHHYVKAWNGVKFHADRIAGAGVLSRYPDVIITLSPVAKKSGQVALNVTTRRHDVDDIANRSYRLEGGRFLECEDVTVADFTEDPFEAKVRAAFDDLSTSGPVRVSELAKKLGKDRSSLYGRLPKYGFGITKGVVTLPVVAVEPDPTTVNNSGGV